MHLLTIRGRERERGEIRIVEIRTDDPGSWVQVQIDGMSDS